jgi:hypothetical protein
MAQFVYLIAKETRNAVCFITSHLLRLHCKRVGTGEQL